MTDEVLREMTIDQLTDLMVTTINEMLLLHSDQEMYKSKAKDVQRIQNVILEKRLPAK